MIARDGTDDFVYVPAGTFTMGNTLGGGSSDELPTHSVILSGFYMGKYEVTQAEWLAVMGSNPSYFPGDLNRPVVQVSWYAILVYCNKKSIAEGKTPADSIGGSINPDNWGTVPTNSNATWNAAICNWSANGYRMATEAEWEYAARGGTTTPDYIYAGSDDINAVAWYWDNSPDGTKPVGGKAANDLGIYDMSGNVWEWCWDWAGDYSSTAQNDPTGPGSGSDRLLRGGYCYCDAVNCRLSDRDSYYPYGNSFLGFRICRAN